MIGMGTGLPLFVALGLLVLGARRTHAILGQLARAKAGFDKASRGLKWQLAARAFRHFLADLSSSRWQRSNYTAARCHSRSAFDTSGRRT